MDSVDQDQTAQNCSLILYQHHPPLESDSKPNIPSILCRFVLLKAIWFYYGRKEYTFNKQSRANTNPGMVRWL